MSRNAYLVICDYFAALAVLFVLFIWHLANRPTSNHLCLRLDVTFSPRGESIYIGSKVTKKETRRARSLRVSFKILLKGI